MTNKFPYGYTKDANGVMGMGTMLTWDQMMTKKTVYNLHPEVRRRFHALIEFAAQCGVPLGVGTGWRVQPNPPPPGFAKPGNSWHESCPVDPVSTSAFAIDTVCAPSWPWMEMNCAAYGLRTFKYVGNEPWHVQPVEISTSRKYASVAPVLPTWPLPGTPIPLPPVGDNDMVWVIKGSDPSYWAWNGVSIAGIPGLNWVQAGVDLGLYQNSEPIIYSQEELNDLIEAQSER